MTLDDVMIAVCTAAQPFVDQDKPNPREVDQVVRELQQMFAEEPQVEQAFVASVMAIVNAARVGWRQDAGT